MHAVNPDNIISFWFADYSKPLWFNSNIEFDTQILDKYHATYLAALEGLLDRWCEASVGSLALVIVLDQFPLNMFRKQVKSFEAENKAIEIAEFAVNNNQDDALNGEQKAFLYMPFMHSENMSLQEKSIALYSNAGLDENLKFARHHYEIVRKFGRFPHRNAILGRTSTTKELEYLQSKEAFLG